jgi:phosphate:Na+ symporter
VLAIEGAAAMVIGANIGTTSTAVLAALGATPNARRVAAAHVLFNGITGIVALIILPLLLALLHTLQTKLALESGAPMLLALFHTTFNLLGVALMWPFTGQLVRRLEGRFRLKEEDEARPRYLDSTTVATPVVALQALTLELAHVSQIVARMVHTVLGGGGGTTVRLERDAGTVAQLIDAIGDFTALMRRGNLPERMAEILPNAIGVSRYLRDTTELALAIDRMELSAMAPELAEAAAQFRHETEAVIDATTGEGFDETACLRNRQALSRQYEELKSQTLRAGSLGHMPVREVVELIEAFKDTERMASYMVKAAGLLTAIRAAAANEPPPPPGSTPSAVPAPAANPAPGAGGD